LTETTQEREPATPRVYRAGRGFRAFFRAVSGLAFAAAAAASCALAFGLGFASANALVAFGCSLAGAFVIAKLSRDRVLLFGDSIEFLELGLRRRRSRRDEIAGYRFFGRALVLELRDARRTQYWVNPKWEFDAVLRDWLTGFPDLGRRGP
jgi:hypothetical protein